MGRPSAVTKSSVLNTAVALAASGGLYSVRRVDIARALGVAEGTISNAFSTIKQLKRAVVRECMSRPTTDANAVQVVAQAIANRDPAAKKVPQGMKDAAARLMAA